MEGSLVTVADRILVTGGHGFAGARLVKRLRQRHPDWTIYAPPAISQTGGLDVTNPEAVLNHIEQLQPNIVVHLAAVAAVTTAVKDPRQAWNVNLGGTMNIVLALQNRCPTCRLLYISSGEVYGESLNTPGPTSEASPLRPLNPYAASKAAAEILVGQAARTGLPAIIARAFNHTGPGQSETFVAPSFAAQIARIEVGLQPPTLLVGNLDEQRDFLDVSDVVDAYVRMIESDAFGQPAVFNVASGRSIRIGDILEGLLSNANLTIDVRQDPARVRPSSIPRMVGDATALRRQLGWSPSISLEETLATLLAEKRASVGVLSKFDNE